MAPRPRNRNCLTPPPQAIDHDSLSPKPNKKLRPNPRRNKQPSNTSRPLAQRLDAMRTTNWRTGPPHKLNPWAQAWEPRKYIITTANGTTSTTIPSVSNIPGYNPEFTFKASPPLNPNNPERSLTLRGGHEARSDENRDLFHDRRLVNYRDLERLKSPPKSPAKLPGPHPSTRSPSPGKYSPHKLPSTDLMSPMHPSRKRKSIEMEYESGSEEGEIVGDPTPRQHWLTPPDIQRAPPTDWAIVDNKLVRKKSIDDSTLLMKEDETITQYLERAKEVHSSAKDGEKYSVRRQTLAGICPYVRRMRVHTELAMTEHMIAPGWLSENATWADIVGAVHSVLRQEAIEALRLKLTVLRRNDNESIKHFLNYIKMLEKEVVHCDDEQLYDFLVKRCLGGLDDLGVQLRAQMWLRIDGLIDEGGELVRSVKVDDICDAVLASSKLFGVPNEFVLLEEFRSHEVRAPPKTKRVAKRVLSDDSGVEVELYY